VQKKNLRYIALIILVAAAIGIALGFRKRAHLLPAGENLPDAEIVFIPLDTLNTLGFIHPDGSGYVTINLELSEGFWNDLRKMSKPTLADWITWSPDGQYLAASIGRYHRGAGHPLLISAHGDLLPCIDNETSPWSSGRSWVLSGTTLLTVDTLPDQEPDRVLTLDMETCSELSTLYIAQPDEGIEEATLSSQGWLAISRGVKDQGTEIVVLNPEGMQELVLSDGRWPAWSPDGEWLVYTIFDDGLYIVRKDGLEKRKVVENPRVSLASWSPDGKWLAYTRPDEGEGAIFKISIDTGEEIKLFGGGAYPNWRWDIPFPEEVYKE
jgi:WD40 repeat protein